MGFSFKKSISKALPGAASGALAGFAIGGPAGAAYGAAGGGLLSSLFGGSDPTTVSQGPLETPEQAMARRELLKFATTGKYGNYTAGDSYTGSLGDFDPTSEETLGLGRLNDLLLAGRPEIFGKGVSNLNELLDPTSRFDPYSATGEFAPFKAASEREFGVQNDRLKQSLAMQGNLFSTDTARQFKDLNAQHGEQINSKLASLYSDYINRKLSAIPLALQAGKDQEALDIGRIDASQRYGGLKRNLSTAKADAAYREWQRSRGELKDPLSALTSVAGTNTPFGPSEVTLPGGAGPFDSILQLLAQFGGQYAGSKAGAKAALAT